LCIVSFYGKRPTIEIASKRPLDYLERGVLCMPFDQSKDKELFKAVSERGLRVTVNSYDGGSPKVQIGPREFENRDGEIRLGKTGRLSLEEWEWLLELDAEIREKMG
jgi:hypothetical protein